MRVHKIKKWRPHVTIMVNAMRFLKKEAYTGDCLQVTDGKGKLNLFIANSAE